MKTPIEKAQGHWVLAGMGKRVLRPGGKELTLRLMEGLQIGLADEVIEFAPGLGFTASIALKAKPKSYTGVELNKEAVAYLQNIIQGPNYRIQAGNANANGLAGRIGDQSLWRSHAHDAVSSPENGYHPGGLPPVEERRPLWNP